MGTNDTAANLLPLVYDELRALAARYLRGEKPGTTLQPTALVHEAYLRLTSGNPIDLQGKTHFFALAAVQMRRILVDRARATATVKRGGGLRRITLSEVTGVADEAADLLELDDALTRLSRRNVRQGRITEMRIFAGMQVDEIASHLGISESTVKADWRVARAWLMKELSAATPPS